MEQIESLIIQSESNPNLTDSQFKELYSHPDFLSISLNLFHSQLVRSDFFASLFLSKFIQTKWRLLKAETRTSVKNYILETSFQWAESNELESNLNSIIEPISQIIFSDFPLIWNSPIYDILAYSNNSEASCSNSLRLLSGFFQSLKTKKSTSLTSSFLKNFNSYLSKISYNLFQSLFSFFGNNNNTIHALEVLSYIIQHMSISVLIQQSSFFESLSQLLLSEQFAKSALLILIKLGKKYLQQSFNKRNELKASIFEIFRLYFSIIFQNNLISNFLFVPDILKLMSLFMRISRNEKLELHQTIIQYALELSKQNVPEMVESICSFWATGCMERHNFFVENFWFLMKFEIDISLFLNLFLDKITGYLTSDEFHFPGGSQFKTVLNKSHTSIRQLKSMIRMFTLFCYEENSDQILNFLQQLKTQLETNFEIKCFESFCFVSTIFFSKKNRKNFHFRYDAFEADNNYQTDSNYQTFLEFILKIIQSSSSEDILRLALYFLYLTFSSNTSNNELINNVLLTLLNLISNSTEPIKTQSLEVLYRFLFNKSVFSFKFIFFKRDANVIFSESLCSL